MIVDSSALMAILEDEPGSNDLVRAAASSRCRMSVATRLEVSIVADARSTSHGARSDELITALEIVIEPVTEHEGEIARRAYQRYGRGSGSPARLNFGDCFAYALSVAAGEPLLFVGEDFTHTDIVPALARAHRGPTASPPEEVGRAPLRGEVEPAQQLGVERDDDGRQ
ncbi:type II toxin-antitoxin system VapC family toxin [Janibacter limosus]|uniref:type II toxin-antitoxin system VapC family toxin n=1 Tax=Janibacter limosus TaxID=53458 RepID=UPI0035D5C643|nr:type II toxin-antitoxin system VapC family toxin [Janibacter limosus]